jgi:hypothetical protein
MSIRDLFEKSYVSKILSSKSLNKLGENAESADNVVITKKKAREFVPPIDYGSASSFAVYGSAEKYYEDSVKRIYTQYPYDGSEKEINQFLLSSSYLDKFVLDEKYPRTTGYIIMAAGGWGTPVVLETNTGYGAPATASYEYITLSGGPHTTLTSNQSLADAYSGSNPQDNVYDLSKHRGSNLELDMVSGSSVEFWLKKSQFITGSTQKEVIFDLWNQAASSSAGYGRLRIELSGTHVDESPFRITLLSGTTGFSNQLIGSNINSASVGDGTWNHYAFTFATSSANLIAKMYINGDLNDTQTKAAGAIKAVTGSLVASLGALRATPSGSHSGAPQATQGWGKLSASLDEFRYWKATRSAKEVGRNWFTQVRGGTNTDDANTDLGVYYKFNEGIVGNSSIDSVVLDFSGRISNGTWTGYSSVARNTGSAIVSASAASREYADPIIYSEHPDVESTSRSLRLSGSVYDETNNASIFNSLPAWIVESDSNGDLKNLIQIIASYFDRLQAQIKVIPQLKNVQYLSSSFKEYPFASHLVESAGMLSSEVFVDSNVLEQIMSRDEDRNYLLEFDEIKNRIYQNIYNNLVYVYKSKGTERSFRNIIHCYGVGEDLVRLNTFANNVDYTLQNNFKSSVVARNLVDFNKNKNATIYQMTASSDAATVSFISGTAGSSIAGNEDYVGFTLEAEVIFPKQVEPCETTSSVNTYILNSSLFGMHSAIPSAPAQTTWATNDYADLRVIAIRPDAKSADAQFKLTSTVSGIPDITTDLYRNVYDDNKWNFAVRLVNTKYPIGNSVTGSSNDSYFVEFYGINKSLEVIKEEFTLSGSVTTANGTNALRSAKRIFAGAHRTNFTGTVLQQSDVRLSSVRYWSDYIPDSTISAHANDSEVYGAENSFRNAFATQQSLGGYYIPELETLALNWNFYNLTGSNALGEFEVVDFSSGSVSTQGRYGWLGKIVNAKHSGKGMGFSANSNKALDKDYIPQAKQALPEIIQSSEMVNILDNDDIYFTREHRPINYFFSIEKSMYQVISDEIVNAFATIVEFNNLIGDPVNRYRQDYKLMEKARNLFFERVENTPDLDKFLDFYKWLDSSLSIFLMQLIPASADSSEDIRNLVESHILERNKYWTKFPTIERKGPIAPEGTADSPVTTTASEITAPNPYVETKNQDYWVQRASRKEAPLATGVTAVDNDRQEILKVLQSTYTTNRNVPFVFGAVLQKQRRSPRRSIHGGINYPPGKDRAFLMNAVYPIGPRAASGTPLNTALVDDTSIVDFVNVTSSAPREIEKRYYPFEITFRREDETGIKSKNTGSYTSELKGTFGAPFNLVSSSVTTGYNDPVVRNFKSGSAVVNLHSDTYLTKEVPMQGPFTDAFVGGHQSRHVAVNRYNSSLSTTAKIDDYTTRPEAWRIELGTRFLSTDPKILGFVGPDYPYPVGPYPYTQFKWAIRNRNVGTKRPVNIRNINYTTSSVVIGNYSKNYEIFQTVGRTTNNKFFIDNEGIALPSTPLNLKTTLPQTNTLSNLLGLKHAQGTDGNFFGVKLNSGVIDVSNRYEVLAQFLRPNRSGSSKTKSVFVNRFSAPGGPDVQSIGYLDLPAAEKSVYNALPFRNLSIRSSGSGEDGTIRIQDQLDKRRGLETLLTLHAGQFGSDATYGSVPELTYVTQPSYQKTNRNRLKRIEFNGTSTWDDNNYLTGNVFDNGFISYSIPRSDLQYSWITSSYAISRIYGHAWSDSVVSSSKYGYEQAIQFVTQSYVFAGGIPVDFANLNTLILDPIDVANNIVSGTEEPNYSGYKNTTFGTVTNVNLLNSLLLHRNGPYGVNTWTQLRGGDKALSRKLRERNILSYVKKTDYDYPLQTTSGTVDSRFGPITQYVESPVVTKYSPLLQALSVNRLLPDQKIQSSPAALRTSYGNALSAFNSAQLNNRYNVSQDSEQPYDRIKSLYLDGAVNSDGSPVNKFRLVRYSETVYPAARNAFSCSVRVRKEYANSFWRNKRENRVNLNIRSFGRTIPTQSMWSLDADSDFLTRNPYARINSTGGAGVLQNNYTQIHSGTITNITGAISFGRRNTLSNAHSVVGPEGIRVPETGTITRSPNTYVPIPRNGMFGGQALWEVGTQAGKTPWYNSYDDYVSEMRFKGKDYSIVPEFRISDHVETYIKAHGGNYLTPISNVLSMTGALADRDQSSESEFYRTYTNSDFLKFFNIIRDDHAEIASPSEIKLSCKGLLKFLPYNGFYPSERTVQIAEMFSSSYGNYVNYTGSAIAAGTITSQQGFRTFMTPMFAPGVMFNTIKAGIAVDFPVMTSSVNFHTIPDGNEDDETGTRYISGSGGEGLFGARIPFEALVEPENYLSDMDLCDMEPHLSAALNVTASWNGDGGNLYKLMAHNFLAESINLFLPESKPTTIVSKPQSSWQAAEKDKVYAARIKLRKSYNRDTFRTGSAVLGGVAAFRNPLTPVDEWRTDLKSTFTMCSAPFMYGPPVGAGTLATLKYGSADGFNPCFTPGYEYGEVWAHVFFTAPNAGTFTIEDLLSPTNLAVSYLRIGSGWAPQNSKGFATATDTILDASNIEFNSMQIDASVNLFGKAQIKKVTYDPQTGEPIEVQDDSSDNAWAIQTKFETPMLNFADASITTPTNGTGSVPRCIWMQYGQPPNSPDKGVFMSVSDIPANYISGALGADPTLTGSLAELVGLGTEEKRLGEVAEAKTIREAVVAIPYVENKSQKKFFSISKKDVDAALLGNENASKSISNMVAAMQKYIIPPRFDFIENSESIDPFAMYLFEFEHVLNKDDLVDIWQGLPPRIGQAFDTSSSEFQSGNGPHTREVVKEVSISHPLVVGELLNGETMPSDIRWMVFKVKQKAKKNYFNMIIKDQLNPDNTFNKGKAGQIGRKDSEKQQSPQYSYNWPYDFFSLVELVKIDASIDIAPEDE